MFTGIVEEVGKIIAIKPESNGKKLIVGCKLSKETKEGDSIAVNGACLTVVEKSNNSFAVDVSFESLSKTNLGYLNIGDYVNLERALLVGGRLDGHIVLGHIDTTAKIQSIRRVGDFFILTVQIDDYIYQNSVEKGSISINGISLTIANLSKTQLNVAIIPFTFENTNLKYLKVQDIVNVEVDIIGKYVRKFTQGKNKKLDEDFLKLHGFV
ncbi:riboflavin synthase [Hippea maritima]|uniref:Riboflavin synthase n=1 Tax=Hippea maritima (strain ATCC 700847 / DSM 10411 / MH2) TaxID=760142 RepID=F2LY72_HIPMA|nr:riboflavin synthase [Hippea maritima]AEA34395.1 riboflavin synthase, alpha subunit [Hippea maritima DSM 10411]